MKHTLIRHLPSLPSLPPPLQHPNCRAVVVSMENITQNYYTGTNRSMFIPNALFKVGGAAILLSNRWADAKRAKYKLLHTVRTHLGAKDDAYQCVFQQEDPDGNVGVKLDKKLMLIAGEALKKNIEVRRMVHRTDAILSHLASSHPSPALPFRFLALVKSSLISDSPPSLSSLSSLSSLLFPPTLSLSQSHVPSSFLVVLAHLR